MSRWIIAIGALVIFATMPLVLSEFYVTLLNYVGLASIVTIGLVLLTGVAGLTSFGQAAFVGIGAGVTARQPELSGLLRRIRVTRDGRAVHVTLAVPAAELQAVLKLFGA